MKQEKQQLNEFIDMVVAYKLIKILTTDFDKTEAFKLGIIDKNGKILKKRSELRGEERAAYTIFHTLIWNLKKLMLKIPGLKSKLGSYAAALFLLKEQYDQVHKEGGELFLESILESLGEDTRDLDVLFEGAFNQDLSAGVYVATHEMVTPSFEVIEEGDVILVGKDKMPFNEIKTVSLYTAVHMDSGEEIIVGKSSIEKIHEDTATAPEIVAGMAVFDVDAVPHDMIHGHQRYERWGKNKFGSLSDDTKKAIRKYSYRNRGKTVALRGKDGTITPFNKGRNK
jgi:hypothetical protein